MIALLRGRVVHRGLDEVVVDVGGVGYRVRVPPGAVSGTPCDEITLHTHLAVREDALTLYGFADAAARNLFETLLGVTGVGPKVALAALGTLGADRLRQAVVTEDVAALTVIPGIGKKGAQRMVLELRERLGAVAPAGAPSNGHAAGDARTEVREALAALGYQPAEVAKTMEALPADGDGSPETLLREALRRLGGS